MGLVRVDLFCTLDGVAQAPGGPEEDAEGGFRFGGWQAPMMDEMVGEWIGAGIDGGIATLFNAVPKYVASRKQDLDLSWANSTLLVPGVGPDLRTAIDALRERHEHIHVIGSLDFAQTLFTEGLFDELTLWVYPIVLGSGKRVFEPGVAPLRLELVEPAGSSAVGAVQMKYRCLDGEPTTGDMSQPDRGIPDPTT